MTRALALAALAVLAAACADHRWSADAIRKTCSDHPMPRYHVCPAPAGECSYLSTEHTCEELLGACDVTLDEYLACANLPECGPQPAACRAFAACGIQVWQYEVPTSSCG